MDLSGAHTKLASVQGRRLPSAETNNPSAQAANHSSHNDGHKPARTPVPISGWQGAQATTLLN
jgi:hypothetical protein